VTHIHLSRICTWLCTKHKDQPYYISITTVIAVSATRQSVISSAFSLQRAYTHISTDQPTHLRRSGLFVWPSGCRYQGRIQDLARLGAGDKKGTLHHWKRLLVSVFQTRITSQDGKTEHNRQMIQQYWRRPSGLSCSLFHPEVTELSYEWYELNSHIIQMEHSY